MQLMRRYTYLVLVVTAYSLLIVAAKWAFFSQLWVILDEEPAIDGIHNHATNKDYALPLPVRPQRNVNALDKSVVPSGVTNANALNKGVVTSGATNDSTLGDGVTSGVTIKESTSSDTALVDVLKLQRGKRMQTNRRQQLLQTIFSNFLHP